MRKFLFLLVALIIAGVALLLLAPNYIPADVYKGRIAQLATAATGRDVTIGGDVRFSFLPRFEVVANDVTIDNVAGGKADYFAHVGELGIGIQVWPLLQNTIRVDRFVLSDADINLETDAKGNGNWEFEPAEAADGAAATPDGGKEQVAGYTLQDISFNDVRLANTRVTYGDATGAKETYDDINLKLTLDNLDSPLKADGDFKYKGEAIELAATIARPRTLLDGGDTDVTVDLGGTLATGTFAGKATIAPNKPLLFGGTMNMDVASLRKLAAVSGQPLTGESGFGPLALKGTINGDGAGYTLKNAEISLDGMTGNGNLKLATSGAKPKLTGALDVDTFNVNTYMGETPTAAPGGAETTKGAATTTATNWSAEPIDVSGLKSFDADLDLTADQVLFRNIKLNRSKIKLTIAGGVLNAVLNELSLYDGSGKGSLMVDARQKSPVIQSEFSLSALRALPFLQDSLDLDRIEGIGNLSYAVTTQGASQQQLVRNLNGTTTIKFVDGALRGVDLVALANAVLSALGQGSKNENAGQENVGSGEQTDFTELGATFLIRNGQMTSQDFQMLNPLLQVLGSGAVDLVAQRVKFKLQPQLLNAGQDANGKKIVVPLLVEGRWDNLSYRPDFESLLMGALLSNLPGGQDSTSGNPLQDLLGGALDKAMGGSKDDKKSKPKNQPGPQSTATPAPTPEPTVEPVSQPPAQETAEQPAAPEPVSEPAAEPAAQPPAQETAEQPAVPEPASEPAAEPPSDNPAWATPDAAPADTGDQGVPEPQAKQTPQTPEEILFRILNGVPKT